MKRITAILTAFLLLMLTACALPETVESISQPVQSAAESISPPVQSAAEEALPPAALGGQPPVVQAFSASAPGEEDAVLQVKQAVQYDKEAAGLIYQGAETLPEGSYAKVTLAVQDGPALMDFYVADTGFIYVKNEGGELASVQIPPLEDALLENYEQAFTLAAAFTLGWPEADEQDVYLNPEDGYTYGLLRDSRFSDYETFYNYLGGIFTRRWIEEALEKNENAPAVAHDGKVYVRLGGRGGDIRFAFVTFAAEEADDEKIILTQTAYYYDDIWQPSALSSESKPCRLVYTGGDWLFDTLPVYL